MDLLLIRSNDMKAVYGDTRRYTACEPPYWAGVIAAYARRAGLEVEILDAEALDYSPEDVASHVAERKPALAGLVVTGSNLSASTQKMQGAGETCREMKRRGLATPVFMWGLHPSSLPERTMREEAVDFVVKGEGLETIARLARGAKEGSADWDGLDGLYYRKGDGVAGNDRLNITEACDIPAPAWDLLPMERYLPHNWHMFGGGCKRREGKEAARGRYAVLATSLGCPYSCKFCAISSLFGSRRVRYMDVDEVMRQIDLLVTRYGVKYIKMLDECFVLRADYVHELCDRLIDRGYDLNIWGYARIDTVSEELLKKLRRAGVRWLAFGVESGSAKTLNGVAKGQFDNEKVRRAVKMTQDAGINVLANFMFGLPDDDMEDMEASYRLCREINPEWINFYVTMPYPGSRLYEEYVANGEPLADEWIAYAQYSYECTPKGTKHLTPAQVLRYRDWAFCAFFEDNDAYFDNIRQKFGEEAAEEIRSMTKRKLKRKLLEMDGQREEEA